MSPRMFIPLSITLTETEYLIVKDLARQLEIDDQHLSIAFRQIIREWYDRQQKTALFSPDEDPDRGGKQSY